jgi:hypothetical protein
MPKILIAKRVKSNIKQYDTILPSFPRQARDHSPEAVFLNV